MENDDINDEILILSCLQELDENPDLPISTVAKEYGVDRSKLRRRLRGITTPGGVHHPNSHLSEGEESGLLAMIKRLDNLNLSVQKNYIFSAVSRIMKRRLPEASNENPTVGKNWVDRFIFRYKLHILKQKIRSRDRQLAESKEPIKKYFKKLEDTIQEYGITADAIWNMDETGFQIGTSKGNFVVTLRRKNASLLGVPSNKEYATCVESISAAGDYIPGFIILSGKVHQSKWYNTPELPQDYVIAVSETGYTNDQLSLAWLKHFDKHTKAKSSGDTRLLIIDGCGSHHTREFIDYAFENNIVPFGLPPQLTHLLQPLDVVIFSPMKHWHSDAVNTMVRNGIESIQKEDFLAVIKEIRVKSLKKESILNAFKRTGICPLNPQIILRQIERLHPEPAPAPANEVIDDLSDHEAAALSDELNSSILGTPSNSRNFQKSFKSIERSEKRIRADEEDYTEIYRLGAKIKKMKKGAIAMAVEFEELSNHFIAMEKARDERRRAKNRRNYYIQSGGVLSVENARTMTASREEQELAKARRRVERERKATEREQKILYAELQKQIDSETQRRHTE